MAFVRSGWVNVDEATIGGMGFFGDYWSSVVKSNAEAYLLNSYSINLNSSSIWNHYGAFPLRCLYPGSA